MALSIAEDLGNFTAALSSGVKVDCDCKGRWYREGILMRIVRWLFCPSDHRVLKVAKAFARLLDDLEKIPVQFGGAAAEAEQIKTFKLHIDAAKAVKAQLEKGTSKAAGRQLTSLALRAAGLRYRIEGVNGGLDPAEAPDNAVLEELKQLAQSWKSAYSLYIDKTLSKPEIAQLETAARYPVFAAALRKDKSLQTFFFKWALRDNCDIHAFVQFPATSNRLKAAFMAGRIGRWGEISNHLVRKDPVDGDCAVKQYVLPFEVQKGGKLTVERVNILDENQSVNLAKDYKCSVKQIIASFANRNSEPGNFEFLGPSENLGARIANHNSLEMGPYNPLKKDYKRPDLSDKGSWWSQIPPLETVNSEQIDKIYGIKGLKEGEWAAVVRSSREDPGLDVDRSHGFIDVLIPNSNGNYDLYSFGKYAAKWPSSLFEKALFITNTVPSKVECPDENHFMAQRQQAMAPKVISEKNGLELMELIRQDLVKAQQGNIVFQFPWENCAWWCQHLMEKLLGPKKFGGPVPNYFRTPLLDATPKIPPLPFIFKCCRKLKGKVRSVAVKVVEYLLCAWRGTKVVENGKKVFKSVTTSPHMKKLEIYHPSALHEKILNEAIPGRVTMGHHYLKPA